MSLKEKYIFSILKVKYEDMICLVGDAAMYYQDLVQTAARHIKAFDILSYQWFGYKWTNLSLKWKTNFDLFTFYPLVTHSEQLQTLLDHHPVLPFIHESQKDAKD